MATLRREAAAGVAASVRRSSVGFRTPRRRQRGRPPQGGTSPPLPKAPARAGRLLPRARGFLAARPVTRCRTPKPTVVKPRLPPSYWLPPPHLTRRPHVPEVCLVSRPGGAAGRAGWGLEDRTERNRCARGRPPIPFRWTHPPACAAREPNCGDCTSVTANPAYSVARAEKPG